MTNKSILDSLAVEGFYTSDSNTKKYKVKTPSSCAVFTCQEFTDVETFQEFYNLKMSSSQVKNWPGDSFRFLQKTPLQLPLFRLVQVAKEALAGRKF